jgi:hypothetical protein
MVKAAATRSVRLFVIAALVSCSDTLRPSDFYGVWGAENAQLTLTNTIAHFESPCWAGNLAIPIQVSGDQFVALGTVEAQGGAGIPDSRVVNMRGELNGSTLTLTIEPLTLGLGPYTMSQTYEAQIVGCP